MKAEQGERPKEPTQLMDVSVVTPPARARAEKSDIVTCGELLWHRQQCHVGAHDVAQEACYWYDIHGHGVLVALHDISDDGLSFNVTT